VGSPAGLQAGAVGRPHACLRWPLPPGGSGGWQPPSQLAAFSQYGLGAVPIRPRHLDKLYAVLRAVQDDKLGETEAIQRLEGAPHWVWIPLSLPAARLLSSITTVYYN
jgi:hypothetical protein